MTLLQRAIARLDRDGFAGTRVKVLVIDGRRWRAGAHAMAYARFLLDLRSFHKWARE